MKLPLLLIVIFLLFPLTATHCSRRHCRILSATTKNQPHRLASSISRSASLTSPLFFFSPPVFHLPSLPPSCLFKLQVPANPA
jgi:hypothetical protein